MQGAIGSPDSIETRHQLLDIPGRIPIALFILVFFGIQILLAARQCFILAKFISAVDTVKR